MKQKTNRIKPWTSTVLTSLCVCLFVTMACTQDTSNSVGSETVTKQATMERESFTIVGEEPSYKGGLSTFYQYVKNDIVYPPEARKAGVDGAVQVQFVINRDSSISDVKVISGIGSGCDQEAIRVVKSAKGFIPGSQRGRTVNTTMLVPITFGLDPEKKNADGSVQGHVIVGSISSVDAELNVKADYQLGEWSGTILTAQGDKLPGANITIIGTYFGTVSDLDGSFSIKAEKNQKLHVSHIGFNGVILKAQ